MGEENQLIFHRGGTESTVQAVWQTCKAYELISTSQPAATTSSGNLKKTSRALPRWGGLVGKNELQVKNVFFAFEGKSAALPHLVFFFCMFIYSEASSIDINGTYASVSLDLCMMERTSSILE